MRPFPLRVTFCEQFSLSRASADQLPGCLQICLGAGAGVSWMHTPSRQVCPAIWMSHFWTSVELFSRAHGQVTFPPEMYQIFHWSISLPILENLCLISRYKAHLIHICLITDEAEPLFLFLLVIWVSSMNLLILSFTRQLDCQFLKLILRVLCILSILIFCGLLVLQVSCPNVCLAPSLPGHLRGVHVPSSNVAKPYLHFLLWVMLLVFVENSLPFPESERYFHIFLKF